MKPTTKPGRENRIIDSQLQSISGPSASPVALSGTYRNATVALGRLRTDAAQRLLVIGAPGISASPNNAADWRQLLQQRRLAR
jgi:hypothetical protein